MKTIKLLKAFGAVATISIATLPLASFAESGTGSATLTATVSDTIAISVGSNIDFGSVTPGQSSTKTHTVHVSTNDLDGFTLKVYGTDLTSGAQTIAKNSAAAAGTEGWALKGGDITTLTAIGSDAASATTLLNVGAQTAVYSQDTTITFTLGTTTNTATGTYSGTVNYVATTK